MNNRTPKPESQRICIFEDCGRIHAAHGYCQSHNRQLRLGQDLKPIQLQMKGVSPEARFWAKVIKTESCWLWNAHLNEHGYGRFRADGRIWLAHRLAYVWANGEVPECLGLDHVCHNRACVNPKHLRTVTSKQNQENRRGAQRDNKTGLRGVYKHSQNNSFLAQVTHKGVRHYLGSFPSATAANDVVVAKRIEFYTHNDLDRISK